MKAMILAAGRGERMLPLTKKTPKPLLTVGNKPLIVHHLHALAKAGISEIIINTHYLGEQIIELIGSGSKFGLNIKYSPELELMDTGGGVVQCLPYLGSEPFLVISADILTNFSFTTLPYAPSGLAHLVMVDNPDYHPTGDFFLNKGKINLTGDGNKYTFGNIAVLRPEFFANSPLKPFPLRELLFKHISDDKVTGQYFADIWHNIGTPADLEWANQVL